MAGAGATPVIAMHWDRNRDTAGPLIPAVLDYLGRSVALAEQAGIGRERVRSTLASRSRSVMSFQVQPAPRITKAPTKNSKITSGS